MNAVYKLIFNISTGTWAVAHELASARGKKSRTRLAAAMAVALALPAGAALAADAPLQCDVNETVSADGLRCEAAASMTSPQGDGIGTMATGDQLRDFINFYPGAATAGPASATGLDAIAIGTDAVTSGNDSVVIGSQVRNESRNTFVWGENYVEVDAASEGSFVISPTGGTSPAAYKKVLVNSANTAAILGTAENAPNSVAIGFNAKTAGTTTNPATGAVAIGDTSSASAAGAVALGSNSIADTANTVSVGSTTLQRKIVNMADGALSATSKEAVNGSQLFATNEAVAQNAADITSTNTALTTLDGRVTTNEGDIANLRTDLTSVQGDVTTLNTSVTNLGGRMDTAETNITDLQSQIGNGSIGLVQQDATSKLITVAGDKEGTEVSFAGVDAAGSAIDRTLSGVADGALAADSDEAVNGSQLFATNEAVAQNAADIVTVQGDVTTLNTSVTNLDGRVTTAETNITDLQSQIGNGSIGLVQQDATSKLITVAGDKEGTEVSFAGVDAAGSAIDRTLSGVADGALAADSDEAVNGSQLFATNEAVAQNAADIVTVRGDVTTLNTSVTNLDGRVTTAETNITDLQSQIGNGSIGLVQQDATSKLITVAGDKEGTEVSFAGTDATTGAAIDRTLSGVARGSADNDAANMGQVKDVLAGLGGGATVNADGSITAPTYSIDGTDFDNVGDAFTAVDSSLTNLDSRTTINEGNISNLTQQFDDLNNGTVGIVTYDDAAGSVNVATDKAGTVVNVAGTAGNRTIAGVADGAVDATSDEAVNGSQLNATNERVATNETNITNLDGRMTVNEGDISNLTQQFNDLSSGSAGMVTHDAATGAINVGANVGGDVVNLAGTDGARRLAGIANGTEDSDAVTLAQLKASGLVDPNDGRALGALVYDDMSLDRATLGGVNGTVIANLGNGLIAAGSREAINGGQLWQMNADWEAKWNAMDGRVGTIEQDIANGNIGGPGGGAPGTGNDWRGTGDGSVAIGDGSNAGGTGSIGIGKGSDASGTGSIAIGDGASASGDNSVAIGAGSTADRDNEYSVGSDGNERVVSNVGRGTRATDAVNLGQMEDRFAAERDWANGRFQAVDKRMDRMGAMNAAMVNMAVSAAGVHTTNRVGAGVGFQNGKSALSVGYQRALSERATITLGGSFSGSEASAGFGAGFGW